MPSAGCPSAAAAATTSSTRDAPSSIENSVCTCRCAKLDEAAKTDLGPHTVHRGCPPPVDELLQCGFEGSSLQVGAGGRALGIGLLARRETAAHLLELLARLHLLREERGLDAVEEALEPPDELGLGHPQLGFGGRALAG